LRESGEPKDMERPWRERLCNIGEIKAWKEITCFGHADVALDNWNSRRGMVGLGGVEGWIVRLLYVDLDGLGNK
jgi:hypothetical protein